MQPRKREHPLSCTTWGSAAYTRRQQPPGRQEPVKPNRSKIMGLGLLAAFAAGAALVLLLEILDMTIRRSADIYGLIDSQLVVVVPYIATRGEQLRNRRRLQL